MPTNNTLQALIDELEFAVLAAMMTGATERVKQAKEALFAEMQPKIPQFHTDPAGFVNAVNAAADSLANSGDTVNAAYSVIKDHEVRESVNRLRSISVQFSHTQQLRERISEEVHNLLAKVVNPSPAKYDETLLPFLALMRRELHANSDKGDREGWLSMEPGQCLLEIYWHVAKLSVAVKNDDKAAIAEHAADVANMAMMQADIAGVLECPK